MYKYFQENEASIIKDVIVIKKINDFRRFIVPALVIILFLIGAYITYNKREE